MGNWVQLVIPLIALAVWIIASIIGTVQQQRAPRRNLPKPPQREPEPTARTSSSTSFSEEDALRPSAEMERKLEEAKRRRRAQTDKQHESDRKRQVESDQARRRATPGEKPAPPPIVASDPIPTVSERHMEPSPTSSPVRQRPTRYPAASAVPSTPTAVPTLSLAQALGAAAQVKRDAPSPVALEVSKLLKQPVSLAAAFMLREVFDPPVAMRKRKG